MKKQSHFLRKIKNKIEKPLKYLTRAVLIEYNKEFLKSLFL